MIPAGENNAFILAIFYKLYCTKQINYRLNDNYFNFTSSTVAVQEACVQDSVPNAETNSAATSSSVSCNLNHSDLGTIPALSSLTDDQKYQILSIVPATLKEYPVNNQKRRFQSRWVEQFPWVRYSESLDGVFVLHVFCFLWPGLIMSSYPHRFVIGRMLLAHHVAN